MITAKDSPSNVHASKDAINPLVQRVMLNTVNIARGKLLNVHANMVVLNPLAPDVPKLTLFGIHKYQIYTLILTSCRKLSPVVSITI